MRHFALLLLGLCLSIATFCRIGKQVCVEDSLVYGYYQSTISALYGYNLELGEKYLLDAHNNIDAMSGSFITQDYTSKYLDMINEQKRVQK